MLKLLLGVGALAAPPPAFRLSNATRRTPTQQHNECARPMQMWLKLPVLLCVCLGGSIVVAGLLAAPAFLGGALSHSKQLCQEAREEATAQACM